MKVYHVIRRFSMDTWGGAEEACLNLAKQQILDGHSVTILTTKALNTKSVSYVEGVKVLRFDYFYPYLYLFKKLRGKFDLKGGNPISISLYKYLRKSFDYDVLHVHTLGYLSDLCSIVAKIRHIPLFVTLHGGHEDVPREERDYFKKLYRWTINLGKVFSTLICSKNIFEQASGVICVGYNEYKMMNKSGHNARYIPNGVVQQEAIHTKKVDVLQKYNLPSDRKIILNVARIDFQKNQEVLIKSMRYENARNNHLVIVGPVSDNEYYIHLNDLIEIYKLNHCVTLIPGIAKSSNDLQSLYELCDLFILSSRHEPFGIVVLEAWKFKKPVIVSKVGGLIHLVDENTNGIFFDWNSPENLSSKIEYLFSNAEVAREMGENGHSKAISEFSWSSIAKQTLDFYLIGKKKLQLNL